MIRELFWSLMHNVAHGCTTPGQKVVLFAGLTALSFLAAVLLNWLIVHLIYRWRPAWRKMSTGSRNPVGKPLVWLFFLTGVFRSMTIFEMRPAVLHYASRGYFVVTTLLVLLVLLRAVDLFARDFRRKSIRSGNVYHQLLLDLLIPAVKTLLWVVMILFLLDNVLHFHVGTLLAGAGVASMAIAFAAQNTIANLFGALSLIIERPFQIGEKIQLNGKEGVVEAIGLRSIRLLASDGTIWFIPNKTVAESSLVNVSQRHFFKYEFVLNLTYTHTPEQMQQAKVLLQEIFAAHSLVDQQQRPPTIRFDNFGPYSLDVRSSCWIMTSDKRTFHQTQNELNLQILHRFTAAGFDFAFPTQTVCLEREENGGASKA